MSSVRGKYVVHVDELVPVCFQIGGLHDGRFSKISLRRRD